jgi:hypothetical protein
MLVELVFQYRTLIGKCELGVGLDWDDIDRVMIIERTFAPMKFDNGKRRFRREKVTMFAMVRGDRINDRVEITEMGPGGLVCRHAPFIARGEHVEIVIDIGEQSYRFHARGVWLKDDGEDFKVGLQLVGMPLCLHKVKLADHGPDIVDKIAEAA